MNNMNYFKKFFGHLKTIRTHRKWVRYYCRLANIGWQGFWHDLSKYHPVEFFESVRYYTGTYSPIDKCKNENGRSYAWLHHRGKNKHHREYWVDYFDLGTCCTPMPYKYAAEMVCDFLGAGRAYQEEKFTYASELEWWKNQLDKNICIHPQTAKFVTEVFSRLNQFNESNWSQQTIVFDEFKKIWENSWVWWNDRENDFPFHYYGRSNDFKHLLEIE